MNVKAVGSITLYNLEPFEIREQAKMVEHVESEHAIEKIVDENTYNGMLEAVRLVEATRIKQYYDLKTEEEIQGLISELGNSVNEAKKRLRDLVTEGDNAKRDLAMKQEEREKAEIVKIKLTPVDNSFFYHWCVPWLLILPLAVIDGNLFNNLFTAMRMDAPTAIMFTIAAVLALDFALPYSVSHLITTRFEESRVSAPAILFLVLALSLLVGLFYMTAGNNDVTRSRLASQIEYAEQNNDPDGNLAGLSRQLMEVPNTREIAIRSALPVATTVLSMLFMLWQVPKALFLKKKKFIDNALEKEKELGKIIDDGLEAKAELDLFENVDKDALVEQLRADSQKAYQASLEELEAIINKLKQYFRLII
jgi:hypothetical protein